MLLKINTFFNHNTVIKFLFVTIFISLVFARGLVDVPLILITIILLTYKKDYSFFKKKEIIFFFYILYISSFNYNIT